MRYADSALALRRTAAFLDGGAASRHSGAMRAQTHVGSEAWKRDRIHVTLLPSKTTAPCSAPAPQVTSGRNTGIPTFFGGPSHPLRHTAGSRCATVRAARVSPSGAFITSVSCDPRRAFASTEIRRTLSVEIGTRVLIHTASRGRRYPLISIRTPQAKPTLRNCVVSSVWQKNSLLVCSEDPSSL